MHTEIDLDNPKDKLRPGMYGIAKIILDTPIKSSTLPSSALVGESKDGKADVYVVRQGKAKKVQIVTGADDGLRVEVISGLSPSDEVIVTTGSVAEGFPVAVVPDAKLLSTTQGVKSEPKKHQDEHAPTKSAQPQHH